MILKKSLYLFSVVLSLSVFAASCSVASKDLPSDILGVSIGMSKSAVVQKLSEVAVFDRQEGSRQEIWRLKDDSRFNYVAVGYDKADTARYVTAFVNTEKTKNNLRFSEIGDTDKAGAEIVAPFHRYIWEVAQKGDRPGYQIIVSGDDAEFATIYSLSKKVPESEMKAQNNEEEEEED